MLEGILFGHKTNLEIVKFIQDIQAQIGKEKVVVPSLEPDPEMLEAIKEESVGLIFNVEVQVRQKEEPTLTATAAAQTATTVGGTSAAAGVATVVEEDEEAAEAGTPNTEAEPPEDVVVPGFGADQPSRLQYSAPSEDGSVEKHSEKTDEYAGTSRNAPCPCGSGKKYKKCHGDPARR